MDATILSCAHTHTTYCDGLTPMEDMAAAAFARGFVSLGFSSHATQSFDPPYYIPKEKENAYIADVACLREAYAGRMRIWLGCERDLYSCAEPSKYEYFIASSHYMPLERGYIEVDGDGGKLRRAIDGEFSGDGIAFARRYFASFALYIAAVSPTIIGHFDIVRKNALAYGLFDEDDRRYRDAALSALEIAAKTGAILEVNTGKIETDARREPYPRPFLLKRWRELGGEVMVNSDCHDARRIDRGYREAPEYLRSCGFDHFCRLGAQALIERVTL